MYSFEQLKIFVTVCECGSFSAAARKLSRAQSG
ncbi:transcriptional regulator, LysR family protein, partial [Vibrio ichthyoenteri ATCC 700023]